MVQAEVRRPIQEYNINPKNPFDSDVVDMLKEPTRIAADLHLAVSPQFWYGKIFNGNFHDPVAWNKFCLLFEEHAADDPLLNNPYTYIDKNWQPVSITADPEVQNLLKRLRRELLPVGDFIKTHARWENDQLFADYLESLSELLPLGRFDEGMGELLRLPTDLQVNFIELPIEYQNDPLKKRYSFEGMLALPDRDATKRAKSDMDSFNKAAIEKFDSVPLVSAKVIVANVVMLSGWLGEESRRISAFNIPNNQRVAEEAGNNLIYLLYGRMKEKSERILSPKLFRQFGFTCNVLDAIRYTEWHEGVHSWRWNEEQLGGMRIVLREAMAADRPIVLSSASNVTDGARRRVIRGDLGFACDDVGKYWENLKAPYGENQPTLEQLKVENDYAPGSYLILREGIRKGAFKKGKPGFSEDILIELSKERDEEYENIAKSGSEEKAERYFKGLLQETKNYPVNIDLNGVNPSVFTSAVFV